MIPPASQLPIPGRRLPLFTPKWQKRRQRLGFSLVEVAMALMIVAVAFVPLLGLIPVGLSAARTAMDQTLASQIVQEIGNEAQQSDFDEVVSSTSLRYFNDQLRELPEEEKADSLYQAHMIVMTSAGDPHLKRLVIQIARNPGAAVPLTTATLDTGEAIWSRKNTLPIFTRSLLLARSTSISHTP